MALGIGLARRLFGPQSLDRSIVKAGQIVKSKGVMIFDIDETLSKKLPLKGAKVKEAIGRRGEGMAANDAWSVWNAHMRYDTMDSQALDLMKQHRSEGYDILALSARGEANRADTVSMFQRHGMSSVVDELMLRPLSHESIGDSGKYKELRLRRHFGRTNPHIGGIYDDSQSVIDMADRMGIPGIKVTPTPATNIEQHIAGRRAGMNWMQNFEGVAQSETTSGRSTASIARQRVYESRTHSLRRMMNTNIDVLTEPGHRVGASSGAHMMSTADTVNRVAM